MFTSWLFVVTVDVGALTVSLQKNTYRAPSKEDLSLRAYTAQRRLNRLRRTACMMFTAEAMAKVIRKLETEVEACRIVVRKDRKLHADLGLYTYSFLLCSFLIDHMRLEFQWWKYFKTIFEF